MQVHVFADQMCIVRQSDCELEKVALLYNKDRLHFGMVGSQDTDSQIAPGSVFLQGDDTYKIEVRNMLTLKVLNI